jgi:hypothetical protein
LGTRGPIRNPNSRRGQAEIRKRQQLKPPEPHVPVNVVTPSKPVSETAGSLPTCDACLPRRVQEIYGNLVVDLAGAKVPIKQIDAHAITMAARCLDSVETAERMAMDEDSSPEVRLSAMRLKAGFSKDLIQWLQLICATPGARARIGLKGAPEKKLGPLAQILAAKHRRAGY